MSHIHLLWDVPIFWWHAWGAVMWPLIEDLGIFGLLFASCTVLVRYAENRWKKSHAEAVRESKGFFRDNVRTPFLTCMLLFVVLEFALGPYEIHRHDEEKIKTNETSAELLTSEKSEIEKLKGQLKEACYNPDRRITKEERGILYDSLRATAEKYHHPLVTLGYFDGDMEALRYLIMVKSLLKDSGFDVDSGPILAPQRNQSGGPPDLGFGEGLSIQIQPDRPDIAENPRQEIVRAILKDFSDAQVEMQMYPVGPGYPVKSSDRIVIWIGSKKVDWLEPAKR